MSSACPPSACESCSAQRGLSQRLGLDVSQSDFVIALAGNPNTGKSTVFNRLTGLRQHTGNWPGKTIARAEGGFAYAGKRFKLVDLPGTYSLRSASPDETVAREFILFGKPDVTLVVVDANCLERNLNLVLQILQITNRAVLCLNLMDEARANGVVIHARSLSRELGIPVVPCTARSGEGIPQLLAEMQAVASGEFKPSPYRLKLDVPGLREVLGSVVGQLRVRFPALANEEWIAMRLLEGDAAVGEMVAAGTLGLVSTDHATLGASPAPSEPKTPTSKAAPPSAKSPPRDKNPASDPLLREASDLRWHLPRDFTDRLTEAIYAESARIAERTVTREGASRRLAFHQRIDRVLTNPWTGYPVMALLFAGVLWLTIAGANKPSELIADVLLGQIYPWLRAVALGTLPTWLAGLLVDGMYLATAWVISVMLPPMMIFFPAFTLLEDLGYLPRVAFNLDRLFQRVGAHGKQALTMAMGYGCNAAGVIAARVIDSPRERLIAIVTNNFALCNGRWPTQILIATIFLGALAPAALSGVVAAGAVFGVAVLGFGLSLLSSWGLSRTLLRGEASTFSLELPPYRPPNLLRTLYTSLIDRTLFVLWRAVVFAMPAGAVIWLVSNVAIADHSLAYWAASGLDPVAVLIGLNGIILLAYVIAIPANEIVIPSILMLTVLLTGQAGGEHAAGVMFETGDEGVKTLLTGAGWTTLTGICLMIFSLCHNPCSTTLYTIYKETRSLKWTVISAMLPTSLGVIICGLITLIWRALN